MLDETRLDAAEIARLGDLDAAAPSPSLAPGRRRAGVRDASRRQRAEVPHGVRGVQLDLLRGPVRAALRGRVRRSDRLPARRLLFQSGTAALHLVFAALGLGRRRRGRDPRVQHDRDGERRAIYGCDARPRGRGSRLVQRDRPRQSPRGSRSGRARFSSSTPTAIPWTWTRSERSRTATGSFSSRTRPRRTAPSTVAAPSGASADAATFSFYGNKIVTTGEGGMVTTNRTLRLDLRRATSARPRLLATSATSGTRTSATTTA